MGLEVLAALRRGFGRTVDRSGLILLGVLTAIHILFVTVPAVTLKGGATATTFASSILATIGFILSMVVLVVAVRVVLQEERRRIPLDLVRRRMGVVAANMVLGYIVAVVVVGIGFILIIPGLYLLVSILFWPVLVAGEDMDFVDAFRQSWSVTRGRKWQVFLFVLGLTVGILALQIVGALIATLSQSVFLDLLILGITMSFGIMWSIASTTAAYLQVREETA